jgi:hypothetical protein
MYSELQKGKAPYAAANIRRSQRVLSSSEPTFKTEVPLGGNQGVSANAAIPPSPVAIKGPTTEVDKEAIALQKALSFSDFTALSQPNHRNADILLDSVFKEHKTKSEQQRAFTGIASQATAEAVKSAREFLKTSTTFGRCLRQAIGVGVVSAMKRLPSHIFAGDDRLRLLAIPDEALSESAFATTFPDLSPALSGSGLSLERRKFVQAAAEIRKYLRPPSRHPTQAIADLHGLWHSLTEEKIPKPPLHCQSTAPTWVRTGRQPKRSGLVVTPKERFLQIEDRPQSPNALFGGSESQKNDFSQSFGTMSFSNQEGAMMKGAGAIHDETGVRQLAAEYVAFLMTVEKNFDVVVALAQEAIEQCVIRALNGSKKGEAGSGSGTGAEGEALDLTQMAGTKADEARLSLRLEQRNQAAYGTVLTTIRNDLKFVLTGIDESNAISPPFPNEEDVEQTAAIEGLRPSYALPLRPPATFSWQEGQPSALIRGLHDRELTDVEKQEKKQKGKEKQDAKSHKLRTSKGCPASEDSLSDTIPRSSLEVASTRGPEGSSTLVRRASATSFDTSASRGGKAPFVQGLSLAPAGHGSLTSRYPNYLHHHHHHLKDDDLGLSLATVNKELSQIRTDPETATKQLRMLYSTRAAASTARQPREGPQVLVTKPATTPPRQSGTDEGHAATKPSQERNKPAEQGEEPILFFPFPPTKAALVAALAKAKELPHSESLQLDVAKAMEACMKTYDEEVEEPKPTLVSANDPVVRKFLEAKRATLDTAGADRWYEVGRRGTPKPSPRNLFFGSFNLYGNSPAVGAELKRIHPPKEKEDVDDVSAPMTAREVGLLPAKGLDSNCRPRTQLIQWMY